MQPHVCFVVWLEILMLCGLLANGAVVEKNFTVRAVVKALDGYQKLTYLVNNQFPAPTIVVEQGDTLIVNLFNELPSDSVALHWHGFEQRGTQWQDGAAHVSQCPADKGAFRYKFVVNQNPGTYFYHDHMGGLKQDGLVGPLIVNPPGGMTAAYLGVAKQDYMGEMVFALHGWLYDSADWVIGGLKADPFVLYPEADSVLINGKGVADCVTHASPRCNSTGYDYTSYTVAPNKVYLLRIINTDASGSFQFSIQGHNFTVVAADGRQVKPKVVADVMVFPGQRYDVLLRTDQPSGNYWITAQAFDYSPVVRTGHAYLHYSNAAATVAPGPKWVAPFTSFDPRTLRAKEAPPPRVLVEKPAHTFEINSFPIPVPDPLLGGSSIQLSFQVQNKINRDWQFGAPLLAAAYLFPNTTYLVEELWKTFSVQSLPLGDVVELVIYNWPELPTGLSVTHPWHLHGYHFWVIGTGAGRFNRTAALEAKLLNLVDPVRRDTVAVTPAPDLQQSQVGFAPENFASPGSWTLIRFIADNPGVWGLHCHKLWHQYMLQTTFFLVSPQSIPPPPAEHPRCRQWATWEVARAAAGVCQPPCKVTSERRNSTDTSPDTHVAPPLFLQDSPDPSRCLDACIANPKCAYVTYQKPMCYFKGTDGSFKPAGPSTVSYKVNRCPGKA